MRVVNARGVVVKVVQVDGDERAVNETAIGGLDRKVEDWSTSLNTPDTTKVSGFSFS